MAPARPATKKPAGALCADAAPVYVAGAAEVAWIWPSEIWDTGAPVGA